MEIKQILICGGGMMGKNIAFVFASNPDYQIGVYDLYPTDVYAGIRTNTRQLVEHGVLTEADVEDRLSRIAFTTDMDSEIVSNADLVIEAVFEDMQTRQVFRVANAHLDNAGQLARKLALEQILKKVAADSFFGDVPVIITGDFNMEPDWEEMQVLKEYPEFVNQTEHIGVTYHGYWKGNEQTSIDFVITRGQVSCRHLEKWEEQEDGVYLSDHYPVCAELVLENEAMGED